MNNVVFWTGIKTHLSAKYGGFEWMEYSRKSWEYWCKKNNCTFVAFEEPYSDITKHRANWQKAIHCWDVLDEREIDPDRVFLIDASSIVKWDAPNIFDSIPDNRLVGWNDLDNLKWVYQSISGYRDFFGFDLNNSKYINSGVIIFNKTHRPVFESFRDFYYDNSDKLIELQDKIVKKGTEQTPFNYWLQKHNVEVNLEMPVTWKLTHLHRKNMLGHNWQTNDDPTPFFIKYGYNWLFTGFEKMQRNQMMKQVWDHIGHNYEA